MNRRQPTVSVLCLMARSDKDHERCDDGASIRCTCPCHLERRWVAA